MKYLNKIYCSYEINESFDSIEKKEICNLNIDCQKCLFFSQNRANKIYNKYCFSNLVKLFVENRYLTDATLKTIEGIFKITKAQIELFSDFAQQLNILYSGIKKPFLKERKDCSKKIECKNKRIFFLERIFGNKFNDGLIISNPILAYIEINQEIKIYTKLSKKKLECQNCYKLFITLLTKSQSLLSQTKIIQYYLTLNHKNKKFSELYSIIFGDYNLITGKSEKKLTLPEIDEKICSSYEIGPYKIKILEKSITKDNFYMISSIIDNPDIKEIYVKLVDEIKAKPKEYFDFEKPHKLNYLLQYEKKYVLQLIKREYGYSFENISQLAELVTYELLKLNPIMALLIDPEIEEIFLDSPKSFIYLDHRQFGRCKTNISLTSTEIESLKTRIRIEAEQRLDEIQPFLKTEIITQYFHVRVTIQIYPLSIDGFSMSVRKLHKKFLTLIDLLKNNTLSIEAAAYLLFNLIHGRNILVIGPVNSGKTTLINSLDMIGKKKWRKIYIEDAIESIDQSAFDVYQLRFQVEPIIWNNLDHSKKAYQVKECLHRTPDIIFIGELIHPKSVESFFFLLKVGLRRCLATAHGESPELMIDRFIFDDKIPPSLIGNLDIVVQMNRIDLGGRSIRRVTRITEIKKETHTEINKTSNILQDASITFIDVFLRDPKVDRLLGSYDSLNELYLKSDAINQINLLRGENISNNNFVFEIKRIQSILNELLEKNTHRMEDIIKIFHFLWQNLAINADLKDLNNSIMG